MRYFMISEYQALETLVGAGGRVYSTGEMLPAFNPAVTALLLAQGHIRKVGAPSMFLPDGAVRIADLYEGADERAGVTNPH